MSSKKVIAALKIIVDFKNVEKKFSDQVIISALKRVVSDFKTAKNIFIKDIIDANKSFRQIDNVETEAWVDEYIKKFKEVKNKNKIKNINEKNIDYWAKKSFKEFTTFVDELLEKPTKTELKKQQQWKMSVNGATKVAEDSEWVVFKIDTYEAATALGTKNWCIVRDEDYWYEYDVGGRETNPECPNNFYFALSKTKSYAVKEITSSKIVYEDPYHKLAIQVAPNDTIIWDAHDNNHKFNTIPVRLPAWNMVKPDMCSDCLRRDSSCDGECCPLCGSEDSGSCECCTQCEQTAINCDCCKECGKTRDDCDCCPDCGETIDNCRCCPICSGNSDYCNCCHTCEETEGNCTCDKEEEKEKEKEEEEEEEEEEIKEKEKKDIYPAPF